MNKLNKIRLPLDIIMTLVSIILMGGNYSSLPRNADCHKLLHFALHNLSDDKRNHSFKSSFYFFEYSERSWVCQNRPSACQPLVLSFYVAAHWAACGDDCKQNKAEKNCRK